MTGALASKPSTTSDGRHDFDFYFGRWRIDNQRLRQRLAGCHDWEPFEARQQCPPILGGLGTLADFVTGWRDGFIGMTLRLFCPQTRQWSIYWAGNHDGVLQPPVLGAFENGVGTFVGHDHHEGTPVLVRFVWSEITSSSARWEQAFSADQGRSWESNWVMRMTRITD